MAILIRNKHSEFYKSNNNRGNFKGFRTLGGFGTLIINIAL